jgi:hypothetical protein
MAEIKNTEATTVAADAQGADDELRELGSVTRETRGFIFGFFPEPSIAPCRIFPP